MNEYMPFRWDLKRREQLGSLLKGDMAPSYKGFLGDVRDCCAKILARAKNSDIVFVGRSPESLHDYLMGISEGTSYEKRVHMLNLSVRNDEISDIVNKKQSAYKAMQNYFYELRLDPVSLVKRAHPVMFTDIVCNGYTFENLYKLIKYWSQQEMRDFASVKRKIRFLGITWKVKSNRYIERWWQQYDWTRELSPRAIKNIAISSRFWRYMGDEQKKIEETYRPDRWGKADATVPSHMQDHLEALRLGYRVYSRARQKSEKLRLARQVAKNIEMREAWLRSLSLEIKRVGGVS